MFCPIVDGLWVGILCNPAVFREHVIRLTPLWNVTGTNSKHRNTEINTLYKIHIISDDVKRETDLNQTVWFVSLLLCWPVHLQSLCKLKNVVIVPKQVGDADCEVELQLFLILVSYGKPGIVSCIILLWLSEESDIWSVTVFRNPTQDIRRGEGKTKVVRVLYNVRRSGFVT